MKPKHLSLAIAALLAAVGLWFAAWRTHAFHESNKGTGFETPQGRESNISVGFKTPQGPSGPGPMLRPPEPNRRFADFTPEQRVEFARKGHGPGG